MRCVSEDSKMFFMAVELTRIVNSRPEWIALVASIFSSSSLIDNCARNLPYSTLASNLKVGLHEVDCLLLRSDLVVQISTRSDATVTVLPKGFLISL